MQIMQTTLILKIPLSMLISAQNQTCCCVFSNNRPGESSSLTPTTLHPEPVSGSVAVALCVLYSDYSYVFQYSFSSRYRAPECLITDGHYGYQMDIWSAGCVFYEIYRLVRLHSQYLPWQLKCQLRLGTGMQICMEQQN